MKKEGWWQERQQIFGHQPELNYMMGTTINRNENDTLESSIDDALPDCCGIVRNWRRIRLKNQAHREETERNGVEVVLDLQLKGSVLTVKMNSDRIAWHYLEVNQQLFDIISVNASQV